MNIDFLKNILMSNHRFWLTYIPYNNIPGSCFLICIPNNININKDYDEITLKDIEDLAENPCDLNIALNKNLVPFQTRLLFKTFVKGVPIPFTPKPLMTPLITTFLKNALNLESDNFYDYVRLLQKNQEDNSC